MISLSKGVSHKRSGWKSTPVYPDVRLLLADGILNVSPGITSLSLFYFSPELLHGTSLGRHIKDYSFFSYTINEALHLSERERNTIIDCFRKIDDEINYGGDKHSNTIIASAIELFLNYCLRFYDRQFITRKKVNKDILTRFEELIDGYFESGKASELGTPTVAWCASELCLSPNYFGDLIKKETGRTALDYIQQKTMILAKEMLVRPDKSIGEVSYFLGYQYPQYFSRAFKKAVGCSPNEYRRQCYS